MRIMWVAQASNAGSGNGCAVKWKRRDWRNMPQGGGTLTIGTGPGVGRGTQSAMARNVGAEEGGRLVAQRFGELRGGRNGESRVRQYENSWNGDLFVAWRPERENVLFVWGGSGHGFKHGAKV